MPPNPPFSRCSSAGPERQERGFDHVDNEFTGIVSAMQAPHILLGIGGGIAAYKTPELVRQFRKQGAEIIPVTTAAATHLVSPLALQAVSGNVPRGELWDADAEAGMGHIELARWADALVIAPATANRLATMAHGSAQDLLSTIYLATNAPVFIAPAMNTRMWEHPATVRNVETVLADGVRMIGPEDGEQACGEYGPGRMSEPDAIAEWVLDSLKISDVLRGVNVLLTSGPTREHIDPVRYITNKSSGKQGFALATAFRQLGADVTVVTGPVQVARPSGIEYVDVESASEMKSAVAAEVDRTDIFVAVAAVADYRPVQALDQKIKKSQQNQDGLVLELTENDDIVKFVANQAKKPFVVGFAAETRDAIRFAREKRARKNLDAIVVNDVSDTRIGFDSAENAVTLIFEGNEVELPQMSKRDIATRLADEISRRFLDRPR